MFIFFAKKKRTKKTGGHFDRLNDRPPLPSFPPLTSFRDKLQRETQFDAVNPPTIGIVGATHASPLRSVMDVV